MSRLDLTARTDALNAAITAGRGRIDPGILDQAQAVTQRATERGGLSAEHTVVALAGATGSGKSSLFNAIATQSLAKTGVKRPTTAHALAAIWGGGAEPLLDWLNVSRRHDMTTHIPSGVNTGLVLLDLPDHDSVVTDHRMRAEALTQRADLLVWVVDPQKYADAALHEGFLRPLAGRSDVVVVVLNQIDRLTADETTAILGDMARLIADDGLQGARVLGVSSRTGQGMEKLRELLAQAASKREAATARLVGDERAAAQKIASECGQLPPSRAAERARGALRSALEDAAHVPTVVDAVQAAALRDARAATGWPLTRWLGALQRDPLRRLGLRTQRTEPGRQDLMTTSLPEPSPAVRSAAALAVRTYVDKVTQGVADTWVLAAREQAAIATDRLPEALDQAVANAPLEITRKPLWWRAVNALQWVLIAAVSVGMLWLAALFAFDYFHLPAPDTPVLTGPAQSGGPNVTFPGFPTNPDTASQDLASQDSAQQTEHPFQIPWPTALVFGGLLLGVVVALVSRVIAGIGARRRAAAARRRLRRSVAQVADYLVREPINEELTALTRCRMAAAIAAS